MRFLTLMAVGSMLLGTPNGFAADKIYDYHHENVLGTSLELKVSAESESAANSAEKSALAEIDRLNRILSSYDSQSEFSLAENIACACDRFSRAF